jgi:hypothetical protein
MFMVSSNVECFGYSSEEPAHPRVIPEETLTDFYKAV